MKKALVFLLCTAALLFGTRSYAAFPFSQTGNQSGGISSGTAFATGLSIVPNQLIFCLISPNGGIPSSPTFAATDTVDTGAWSISTLVYQSGPQMGSALIYKVTNGTGTVSVTVTGFAGAIQLTCQYVSGFVTGATIVTADSSISGGNTPTQGTVNPATGPAFTNTVSNEYIIAAVGFFTANGNFTQTGSYTNDWGSSAGGGVNLAHVNQATPAALSFGGNASSTGPWGAFTLAVQDGASPPAATGTMFLTTQNDDHSHRRATPREWVDRLRLIA